MPRLVYKPHSVQRESWVYAPNGFVPNSRLGDHLSRRRVAAPLKRPTRDWLPPEGEAHEEASHLLPSEDGSSLLGLAPGGGYLAARITADAGGLLHRLFTLTPEGADCFCGPDPAG